MTATSTSVSVVREGVDRPAFRLALAVLVAGYFAAVADLTRPRGVEVYATELTAVVALAAVGTWVARAGASRANGPPAPVTLVAAAGPAFSPPLLPLTAYGLIALAGLLYAHDLRRSVDGVSALLIGALLLGTVILLVTTPRALAVASWALVGAALVIAVVNMGQHLSGRFDRDVFGLAQPVLETFSGGLRNRIGGPFGDPNYLAQRLVVAIPSAAALYRVLDRSALKVLAATAAGACAVTVLVSGSRGGLVALLVVVALTVRRAEGLGRRLVLWCTVALLLAGLMFSARARERVLSIPRAAGELVSSENTASGRAREWQVAIVVYGDHPLFGVGIGNFPAHYVAYGEETGADLRLQERTPHSVPLQVATETGLAGLAALAALVIAAFGTLHRSRRRLAGAPVPAAMVGALGDALVGYLVAGLFLDLVHAELLWILLGMAFASAQLEPDASV